MENSTAVELASVLSTRQLDGLGASLFTHASPNQATRVVRLCGTDRLGAVYSLRGPTRSTMQALTALHDEQRGDLSAVLIDAARYSGKKRIRGTTVLDESWVKAQHQAGLQWALTDSGYIGDGDRAALDSILQQTARLHERLGGRVIGVVPASKTWVTHRADELRAAVESCGVPVALMVEADNDPFDSKRAVLGLTHLLESDIPLLSLRNDISAIGALAFGAAAGAIGTTTGLRHFFPIRDGGGGGGRGRTAAVVPTALVYKQLEHIADAYRRDPGQPYWLCTCLECAGKTLNWIIEDEEAFAHSVMCLARIAAGVLNSPDPTDRRVSWIESCRVAQSTNYEISSAGDVRWEPPKFQNAWVKAWHDIARP